MARHHQHHHEEITPEADAAIELDAFTRDVLAGGIQSDLLRARMAQHCAAAPTAAIQVQVDRTKAGALANTLRDLIADPATASITDAHGKVVQLRPGTTHEDLAALVCSQGCKLHLRPAIGKADAAAAIATGTDGRVLLPGDGPLSSRTIADKVLTALRTHNDDALTSLATELKLLGLVNTSEASRAFISTVTGTPLAGVSEEWQQCMSSLFTQWRERGAITITAGEEPVAEPAPSAADLDDVTEQQGLEVAAGDVIPAAPSESAVDPTAAAPAVAGDGAVPLDAQGITVASEAPVVPSDYPRMSGSGTAIELMETLQFLHITGKTGCLVVGSDPTPARLWLTNGGVIHAEEGTVTGIEAAGALVRNPTTRVPYGFYPDEQAPAATIDMPTPMLLLDFTRQMDEQES